MYCYKIGRETCRSWCKRTNGAGRPVHQNPSYDTWTDCRPTSRYHLVYRQVLSSICRRYPHCINTQQRNVRNVLAYMAYKFQVPCSAWIEVDETNSEKHNAYPFWFLW